jgi:hypothetical protein
MVVRDNDTRWNSSYAMIHRALKLRLRIENLVMKFRDELEDDTLSEADWQQLTDMELILQPFQEVTKRLEGRATEGSFGSMWEALPAVESLIKHLDAMKKVYTMRSHPNLAACLNLAWSKLDSYYIRLDKTPAYAASVVLHPQFRIRYFKDAWKGPLAKYYPEMERSVRDLYDQQYSHLRTVVEEEDNNKDFLQKYLDTLLPTKIKDEFDDYAKGQRLPKLDGKVYDWWMAQDHLPSVKKMAFDLLCVPAMSSETERCFRGTKLGIPETRKRLDWQIIEASEVSRGLMRSGLL